MNRNHSRAFDTLLRMCGSLISYPTEQFSKFKFKFKFIKKLRKKIQNRMYHCSQLAIAIRGEQWLDTN